MNVVAFNGSPRKTGNTRHLLESLCGHLQQAGVETEIVQLGGESIHGCRACYGCFKQAQGRCVFDDDGLNGWLEKMVAADGIVIGTPTYYANVSAEVKALLDRAGLPQAAGGARLKRKVGAAVVAVRRAGAVSAFDAINHFFHLQQMIVPGASYWNLGIGMQPGEVDADEEGQRNMRTLAENMVWLMERIRE